jgi:hypothetical protein
MFIRFEILDQASWDCIHFSIINLVAWGLADQIGKSTHQHDQSSSLCFSAAPLVMSQDSYQFMINDDAGA